MTTIQANNDQQNKSYPPLPHAVMSNVYNNNMQMEEFGKG